MKTGRPLTVLLLTERKSLRRNFMAYVTGAGQRAELRFHKVNAF